MCGSGEVIINKSLKYCSVIKELVQFTDSLDSELKAVGIMPKEGLHIIIKLDSQVDGLNNLPLFTKTTYHKNKTELTSLLMRCAAWTNSAWMLDNDTNKCIDKKTKAIHSCSPYCLAIKKTNLNNGENYKKRKNDGKSIVYDSLSSYFKEAIKLIIDEDEKLKAEEFFNLINTKDKIHYYLAQIEEYEKLKDSDYVIFYADFPVEVYKKAYDVYMLDKIFTSNEYNSPKGDVTHYTQGVSAFFNGFPDKKRFLTHQTATFDIAGRIIATDALKLLEIKGIFGRNKLPNPLPIFVYDDERKESIALFKRDILESGSKRGYREIIEELQVKLKKELGNYYLLFYQAGEVKDFDFVSKFEYELKDTQGNNWYINDLFGGRYTYILSNVFEFERTILPIILNNTLIVKTKTDSILFKYFDDIDAQYCKTDTYLLVMKYRKALYDFIYKSNRTAFIQKAFEDILITGLLDDIRLDKYENHRHSEDLNIRQKLNILFSLYHNFQPFKQVNLFMATQITELRQGLESLATGEANINSDGEFAFVAGQVIYYILSKSKSADKSYSRLEPFLQLMDAERLKQSLLKIFNTYKHERFSRRFSNPFAQVMSYNTKANLKDIMPLLLAGFFSENQLFGKVQEEEEASIE